MSVEAEPCDARMPKRRTKPCGEESRTSRVIQAAPGLWIHVNLCHFHQAIWDQAVNWKERRVVREPYYPESEFCVFCDGYGGKKYACAKCGLAPSDPVDK